MSRIADASRRSVAILLHVSSEDTAGRRSAVCHRRCGQLHTRRADMLIFTFRRPSYEVPKLVGACRVGPHLKRTERSLMPGDRSR